VKSLEIIQIVGLGLLATVLAMIIKDQKPLFAFLLTMFTGLVIFMFLIGKIHTIIELLQNLTIQSNINPIYLKTILKIIGIAYIAEFGAQIVRDAGQEAVAAKIELSGKILIMVMAVPIITVIVESVIQLMPT
jgi:stage III sporulation protein AD